MARKDLVGLRVGVLAADGFEQVETTVPIKALKRRGAEVQVVSLRPGTLRGMNFVLPGKKLHVDVTVFKARPEDYDALLIPGGYINPDLLRQSERVLQFVREFDRTGRPVAFLCHAPWVLASANLVRGRRLTSWPGIADDVRNAGGTWEDAAVVRDRNWVSSRGPHDLRAFRKAMIELFREAVPERVEVVRPFPWRRWIAGAVLAVAAIPAYRALRVAAA